MDRKHARFTCRVYEDHPLFDLTHNNPLGGRTLLDYATAWHAFSLGQKEAETSIQENVPTRFDQNHDNEITDGFLEDALS